MPPTHHDHYKKNLAILHKYRPKLWQSVTQHSGPLGELFVDALGFTNLRLEKINGQAILLRDETSPEEEAIAYLEYIPPESQGVAILIGMGIGTLPTIILHHRPELQHFIIFEPNLGIFKQALTSTDLSHLLADPKVIIHVGPVDDMDDAVQGASRAIQVEHTHILRHLPSFFYDEEKYLDINKRLFVVVNRLNVSGSTNIKMGLSFLQNRLLNLTSIAHHRLAEELRGCLNGVPAILVGGGPSLDNNIGILTQAHNKAVILAVDSTLPALIAHDVVPHFLSAIDPDEVIFEKVADYSCHATGTSLLCLGHVTPKVPKTFAAKQVFWGYAASALENWINASLGGTVTTGNVQTVAHLNLVAAIFMGCSPIIFMGQDLAYPGDKSHAGHTVLTSHELMEERLRNKDDMLWVKGNNSDQVPTDRALHDMALHFEEMIAAHQNTYINATEGGAYLEGTEVMALRDAISKYCVREYPIDKIIDATIADSKKPDILLFIREGQRKLDDIKGLKSKLEENLINIQQVQQQIKTILKKSSTIQGYDRLPANLKKNLAEIDKINKIIDGKNEIWLLLQEVTLAGLKDSERLQHAISSLAKTPGKYLQCLAKKISRLALINKAQSQAATEFEKNLGGVLAHIQQECILNPNATEGEVINTQKNLLEIAELYMRSNDYVLAKNILEQGAKVNHNSPETFFYLGCIAAHQRDYQKAEGLFSQALLLDHSILNKIEKFRAEQGDTFIGYAEVYRKMGRDTYRNLLLKGLRICPTHQALHERIRDCAAEDLDSAQIALKEEGPQSKFSLVENWHTLIKDNQNCYQFLGDELRSKIFYTFGCVKAFHQDYQQAFSSLQQALAITPDNPDVHTTLTSILFELGNFEEGIKHLKRAVEIDRSCATHWEELGDVLHEAGQEEDAIAAYEQCFLALNEHHLLLKKIGDCYHSMGNTAAAAEAYRILQERTLG